MFRVLTRICIILPLLLVAEEPTQSYQQGDVLFKVDVPFASITTGKGGFIVTDQTWFNNLSTTYGIHTLAPIFSGTYSDMENYYKAQFDTSFAVSAVASSFRTSNGCQKAWGNSIGRYATNSNDPYFSNQWALTSMNIPAAWDLHSGSSNVIVACVDNGIDLGDPDTPGLDPHPDLISNLWNDNGNYGYSFSNTSTIPEDREGSHGTRMAGLIAATTNNTLGIAGVSGGGFGGNSGVKLMAVQISTDALPLQDIAADGINWAVANGADVISCSFSYLERKECGALNLLRDFDDLELALEYAAAMDVVVVAAMGNDGRNLDACCAIGCDRYYTTHPADYTQYGVISVAAIYPNDTKMNLSNHANFCVISAPGSENWSTSPRHTDPSGYYQTGGTSAATAHTAGVAGLVRSFAPEADRDMVTNILTATATDIDATNPTYAGKLGAGKVNAGAALSLIDDLPARPLGVTIESQLNHPRITWDANDEADLVEYRIHITYENRIGSNPRFWTYTYDTQYTTATEYIDHNLTLSGSGTVYGKYKVAAIDVVDNTSLYSVQVTLGPGGLNKPTTGDPSPTEYVLREAFPNPFNPITTLQYELPSEAGVSIMIFDALGRIVYSFGNQFREAGYHSLEWDGKDGAGNQVGSGVYLISFSTPEYNAVRKVLLVR